MTKSDDKHDHELAAWLDGSDGVSAAYREAAHEEPPPALDHRILRAAREAVERPQSADRNVAPPSAGSRNAAQAAGHNGVRKPYALAASVMIAVAGLSLYIGVRDDVALQPGAAMERVIQLEAPAIAPQQNAVSAQDSAQAQDVVSAGDSAQDAAAVAEVQRSQQAEAQAERVTRASEAERAVASNFEQRRIAPAAPIVGAGDADAAIPPTNAPVRRDTFARSEEVPAIVITGPLLEQIEAEAEAAQAGAANVQLEEIMITGSRIMRRANEPPYRATRDEWLAAMRTLVDEIERSRRLIVARRYTAVLERQLDDEIALFLAAFPDIDIDAELGLAE